MRKALAQNPNLLRTLLGLSFTLIFLLSYAVYANTISTSYYTYTTTSNEQISADVDLARNHDAEANVTSWSANVTMDRYNLTWVEVTASALADGAVLRVQDAAGLYTHPLLGDAEADGFSCVVDCRLEVMTERAESGGTATFLALATNDPAARSNGTVVSNDLEAAWEDAASNVEHRHGSNVLRITIEEPGNRSTAPTLSVRTVNEELASVTAFNVDVASEFIWALTAVFACFSLVLLPAFAAYAVARRREQRTEAALMNAHDNDDLRSSPSVVSSNGEADVD